jgi:hypothetical protein
MRPPRGPRWGVIPIATLDWLFKGDDAVASVTANSLNLVSLAPLAWLANDTEERAWTLERTRQGAPAKLARKALG